MANGWVKIGSNENPKVRRCVDLAVDTANSHKDYIGGDNDSKERSTLYLQIQMIPSDNIEHVQVYTYESYQGRGDVSIVFHRFKYMSEVGIRPDNSKLGEVWILTIVFENSAFPQNGNDQVYVDFLNDIAGDNGILQEFLNHQPGSLYSVGKWNPGNPTNARQIGQLERVARDVWDGLGGRWEFIEPFKVNRSYKGSDGQRIPDTVLERWGKFSGKVFGLNEIRFHGRRE